MISFTEGKTAAAVIKLSGLNRCMCLGTCQPITHHWCWVFANCWKLRGDLGLCLLPFGCLVNPMSLGVPALFPAEADWSVLDHPFSEFGQVTFQVCKEGRAPLCCPATAAVWGLYLCHLGMHTAVRLKYCGEIALQGAFFVFSGVCYSRAFHCCYSRLNLSVCPPPFPAVFLSITHLPHSSLHSIFSLSPL